VILFILSKLPELFSNEKESRLVFFVPIFKKKLLIVSHVPLRKEKDCLNCGAIVQGRYCHVCGQENVVPKETFWHMVTHFFYDITHFDSKFFESVKDLIIRPGFLSTQYMLGKRASYLHPVRMYVFTSAIFFLIFFTFFKPNTAIKNTADQPLTEQKRKEYINAIHDKLKKDSTNEELKQKLIAAGDTTKALTAADFLELEKDSIHTRMTKYRTFAQYDSAEQLLPASKRDGWLKRRIVAKLIAIDNRVRENPNEALKEFSESLLHRLPYMLFISLPLFALILKLVYFRRKSFYYADHGVFTIHLYIFSFLLLLVVFALDALKSVVHIGLIDWIIALLLIGLLFYLYKAMRNFYGQRRAKTFIKFMLVGISSFVMMLILFVGFIFFSAFTF
jgi:hypothetical protein